LGALIGGTSVGLGALVGAGALVGGAGTLVGLGVLVGLCVDVGGLGVAVGGLGVLVGLCVDVGGLGVAVVGLGVAAGCDTDVSVAIIIGFEVAVGCGVFAGGTPPTAVRGCVGAMAVELGLIIAVGLDPRSGVETVVGVLIGAPGGARGAVGGAAVGDAAWLPRSSLSGGPMIRSAVGSAVASTVGVKPVGSGLLPGCAVVCELIGVGVPFIWPAITVAPAGASAPTSAATAAFNALANG
jgi:hypothetical protein